MNRDAPRLRRYVLLPPGSVIVNADEDSWGFPPGAVLWKEVAVGGKRIETQMVPPIGTGKPDTGALAAIRAWISSLPGG